MTNTVANQQLHNNYNPTLTSPDTYLVFAYNKAIGTWALIVELKQGLELSNYIQREEQYLKSPIPYRIYSPLTGQCVSMNEEANAYYWTKPKRAQVIEATH